MKELSIITHQMFYWKLLVQIICMAALETQMSTLLSAGNLLLLLYNVYKCYCRKCHFLTCCLKHCFMENALGHEMLGTNVRIITVLDVLYGIY